MSGNKGRVLCFVVLGACVLAPDAFAQAVKDVNVVNTPGVTVTNTPSVTVANTPSVNVANFPSSQGVLFPAVASQLVDLVAKIVKQHTLQVREGRPREVAHIVIHHNAKNVIGVH